MDSPPRSAGAGRSLTWPIQNRRLRRRKAHDGVWARGTHKGGRHMQPAEITPEDIETASFTVAIRGYDKQEVEAFLADTADHVRVLTEASGSAYVDLGEEMGELLQHA